MLFISIVIFKKIITMYMLFNVIIFFSMNGGHRNIQRYG